MIAEAMPWKSPLVRARLSLGLVATFPGLLAIFRFLKPEFNSGHLISEYQLGRHGWMMSLAFCTLGIGAMADTILAAATDDTDRLRFPAGPGTMAELG